MASRLIISVEASAKILADGFYLFVGLSCHNGYAKISFHYRGDKGTLFVGSGNAGWAAWSLRPRSINGSFLALLPKHYAFYPSSDPYNGNVLPSDA